MSGFLKVLMFIIIALYPVYLFPSGLPQLSHLILCLTILLTFASGKFKFTQIQLFLSLLFMYALLRDVLAVFFGYSVEYLVTPLYLLFNILSISALAAIVSIDKDLVYVKAGLFFAVSIAFIFLFATGFHITVSEESERAIGSFNNPNQLGYFSVCVFAISGLIRLSGKMSLPLYAFFVIGSVFLAVASLSKAAMIAVMIGAGWSCYALFNSRYTALAIFFVFALLAILFWDAQQSGFFSDYMFSRRLEGIGEQNDDTLSARGYLVFSDVGFWHFVLGYGTALGHEMAGHEIHSTIFSFFGYYGAIGALFFLIALFIWAKLIFRSFGISGLIIVCAPPMLYGLTHNGSRFAIFWFLVTLSICVTKMRVLSDRGPALLVNEPLESHSK